MSPPVGAARSGVVGAQTGDAIPDSGLYHHHDAQDLNLSDQDTVTTWNDLSGEGHDLSATGSPTYIETGGYPYVSTNGSDDYLDGPDDLAQSQPNTIFVVFAWDSLSDGGASDMIFDRPGESPDRHAIWNENDSADLTINAGSALNVGGTPDTNLHLYELETGSTDALTVDGTEIGSGDAGGNQWDGLRIGAQDGLQSYTDGRYGEILGYNRELSSSEKQNVRSYIESRWPVTIA